MLDVVYNPQRTGICLQAERAGLPFESGLSMLVAQACRSAERFLDMSVEDERIEELVSWLKDSCTNVFFIGMPGVGKTSAARGLAHLLGRPFVDLDDAFRLKKTKTIKAKYSSKTAKLITPSTQIGRASCRERV